MDFAIEFYILEFVYRPNFSLNDNSNFFDQIDPKKVVPV